MLKRMKTIQDHSEVEIKVVPTAGFCFGVKRAYKKARETVSLNPCTCIATIGPLIHNPQVVEQLKKEGVEVLNSLEEFQDGILVVRSHGLPPKVLDIARKKGLKIVDATCPYVKKLQKDACRLWSRGYFIILVGDKNHPEIKGVQGALPSGYVVVKDLLELKKVKLPDKIAFLAQTTQNIANFRQVVLYGIETSVEVKVFNTICDSTSSRQQMTQNLASEVDLMVIVGGRNSANTSRLFKLSKEILSRTYLVEIADEFDVNWLSPDIKEIGISAGASTPGWIIEQVVDRIRGLVENLGDVY